MLRLVRLGLSWLLLIAGALLYCTAALLPSSGPAGAQSAGPTDISHFTCYTASTPTSTSAPTFTPPAAVELTNQFAPNGFFSRVSRVVLHCNPASKTVTSTGATSPEVNPNAHLLCFKLPATPALSGAQPVYNGVQIENQFGTGTISTGQPLLLCVPSWKNLATPSRVVQPPGLDHYVCYAVTNSANMPPAPTPVKLHDQFNTATGSTKVTQFGAPNMLCVPTLKSPISATVGALPSQLFHPEAHLLCYPITAQKGAGEPAGGFVTDQNQFGIGQVNISTLSELCVPSFKTFPQPTAPTGTVVITKLGSVPDPVTGGTDSIPLQGATFTAFNNAAHTVNLGTCTTDYSGTCQINGLPAPGSVVISETTPPPGFSGGADQTVSIPTSPGTAAVSFTDQQAAGS